jgi:nifR3 family TIM-barrel protein
MRNFWEKLPRPFFALAPMADVTDAAFRRIITKYGKPDVMWTEFVSADGLALADETGKAKLMRDLLFTDAERPIVAQFFTSNPAHMEHAAALAQASGFDGVDINMGCPDKSIEKQRAGAALMKTPELAVALIAAAKRGAPDLPISVKTRLGYNKDVLEEWLPVLLAAEPAAITVHARTRKDMSTVPARWERIQRAVEIRNEMKSKTLIIGNGDVVDIADAKRKAEESGADGVMLGRAIFGTPWLFATENQLLRVREFSAENSLSSPAVAAESPSSTDFSSLAFRLRVAVEHAKLFEELLGDVKNFAVMKKHFKAYAEGFPGARELRAKLFETNSAHEIEEVIEDFLKTENTAVALKE